jgi:hypothetical protein
MRRRVSVGITLNRDDVRVLEQSIHGGAGEQWIAKQESQFVHGAIGGQHGRAALVTLANDFVKVERLVTDQWTKAKVVDEE